MWEGEGGHGGGCAVHLPLYVLLLPARHQATTLTSLPYLLPYLPTQITYFSPRYAITPSELPSGPGPLNATIQGKYGCVACPLQPVLGPGVDAVVISFAAECEFGVMRANPNQTSLCPFAVAVRCVVLAACLPSTTFQVPRAPGHTR